jgi:hypothetical protein
MIFRIPSRTVQYGYVELPLAMESGMSPEMIAAAYVNYVHAFQKEEEATIERLKEAVRAPVAASTEADDLEAMRAAIKALDKGLGGATEVVDPQDDGGLNHGAAPWDATAEAPKPKPWEVGDEVTVGGTTFTKVSDEW